MGIKTHRIQDMRKNEVKLIAIYSLHVLRPDGTSEMYIEING